MTEYMTTDDASTSESQSKAQTVLAALCAWQDNPNDEAINKRVQQQCLEYLLAQGDSHWFCKQHRSKDQDQECQDALDQVALFCVRLVGYKPAGKVLQWRQHLEKLLLECHSCVEGWVDAQTRVGQAYLLKRWLQDHVNNWYNSLYAKEKERVTQTLSAITDAVPSCLVYNILLDHALYSQSSILDALSEHLARSQKAVPLLQGVSVPPGLLALLVSEDARLREWAQQCVAGMPAITAEDTDKQDARHLRVVTAMLDTIATRDRLLASESALPARSIVDDVAVTTNQKHFWQGVVILVNLLSNDILQQHFGGGGRSTDIVRLVSQHLGDKDDHWVHVLEVFKVLLTTLGDSTWKNFLDRKGKGKAVEAGEEEGVGDVGYAGARLYDALDNPRFFDTLSSIFEGDLAKETGQRLDQALFDWLYPFLRSLRTTTYFSPCFTSIMSRLIDNYGLQTRFSALIRARCIRAALQLSCDIFPRPTAIVGKTKWPYLSDSIKDLERHSKTIVEVAFDRNYASDDSWKEARQTARRLTSVLCKRDALNIRDYIYGLIDKRKRLLSSASDSADTSVPPLQVCEEVYTQSANAFTISFSSTGLAGFAEGLACTAHLAKLNKRAWLQGKKHEESLRAGMIKANQAIDHLYGPIARMLTSLADEDPTVIKKTLKLDGVVESLVTLILSPTEKVAMAAQSVIRQAFDASSRADCFKALFTDFPEQALRGILMSLRTFKESASRLPEACDQAKRLVRCLTDVVNVLCDPTQPMIRDAHWVEKHGAQGNISKIWNLMCYDIALIFERTVKWSVMFENDEMTDWMRDALVFLTEMLDEIRAFEAAVTGISANSGEDTPKKISTHGRDLVDSLNEPLNKLLAWLRLNDDDLLDQAVTAIVRMLDRFAKAKMPLSPDALKQLRKTVDRYRDPKTRKESQLKAEHLDSLVAAVARHPEYEEEFSKIETFGRKPSRAQIPDADITVIESDPAESDSESDSVEVVAAPSKSTSRVKDGDKRSRSTTGSKGKIPLSMKSTSTIPSTTVKSGSKALPSSASSSGATFKVAKTQPAQPLPKYKTAPTKMKNALYSHSAMKAAKDQDSSDDEWSDAKRPSALARLAEQRARLEEASKAKLQQPRKTKMLELQEKPKVTGQQRGQRIMTAAEIHQKNQNKARMRYNPDYTDLHRQILQWNYNHQGSIPHEGFRFPRSIPAAFENARHYIETFYPLLLLECWNEIVSAREELQAGTNESEPFTGRLAGRLSVDDFVEIYLNVDRMPERSPASENDIVLMKGHCETIAKVHQVLRKQGKIDVVLRVHLGRDTGVISHALVNGTKWTVHKLFTLSTAHREYGGLMALPYYDLVDDILVPPHHTKPDLDDGLLQRAMAAYRVNKPQAGAILSALSSKGFSLIQGPPGTGKTKTILGLVGAFLSNRGHRSGTFGDSGTGQKILLCAPSNAAVDEVAKRLKEGVFDSDGKKFSPKVVRIGSEFSVNVSVSDIFLDALVEKALGGEKGTAAGDAHTRMTAAREKMANHRTERDEKRLEKNNTVGNSALLAKLSAEISDLTAKINDLAEQLDRERDAMTTASRAQESSRRKVRQQILAEADVICSTLSGSGHEYLASYDFETVIIDEAAQSVEISSLIPLKYNCQRCIMVGDPNQLPPTVKSREATNAGYNKSLFVRLHSAAPEATHLLSIQYRMHPDISSFPSKAFYESRLDDGPDMATVTKQSWHTQGDLFPPYAFMHVKGSREEAGRHHSIINKPEAAVAAALYGRLLRDCKGIDLSLRVGIITPYKGQVGELKRTFRRQFGDEIVEKVDFNTVDGFQGQEKDIILLSCVRGGKGEGHGVGFLSDTRRMNVALTRARSSLFVLGDSKALQANEHWKKLVEDASERGFLREVDTSTFAGVSAHAAKVVPTMPKKINIKPKGNDLSKKIMSAPEGLMTPSQLASKNSTLGDASPATAVDKKPSIGVKRRLMDSIKTEETPLANKKAKEDLSNESNAALAFSTSVKAEELEEGELSPMEGVQYTNQPPQQPTNQSAALPATSSSSVSASSAANSTGPSSTGSNPVPQMPPSNNAAAPPNGNAQPNPPLRKPATSSMFIPRKRTAPPPKFR